MGSGRKARWCCRLRQREVVWNHGGLALRGKGRGGRAANQNWGLGGRGGRQPRPRSSRTSNKQSVWRGRGGGEPCSNGRSVRHAPRYLECPGQHPHRDSLHGLPLLEMRRAQLVLAHWRTGRRQRGRKHGPTLRRRLWAQGPPAAPASEHRQRGAAQKVSRRPGKENSALFLEKKKNPVFSSKNTFSFQSQSFGPCLFKDVLFFTIFMPRKK